MSGTTWALIRDEIETVERGAVALKGIHYPMSTFEAVERSPQLLVPSQPPEST